MHRRPSPVVCLVDCAPMAHSGMHFGPVRNQSRSWQGVGCESAPARGGGRGVGVRRLGSPAGLGQRVWWFGGGVGARRGACLARCQPGASPVVVFGVVGRGCRPLGFFPWARVGVSVVVGWRRWVRLRTCPAFAGFLVGRWLLCWLWPVCVLVVGVGARRGPGSLVFFASLGLWVWGCGSSVPSLPVSCACFLFSGFFPWSLGFFSPVPFLLFQVLFVPRCALLRLGFTGLGLWWCWCQGWHLPPSRYIGSFFFFFFLGEGLWGYRRPIFLG